MRKCLPFLLFLFAPIWSFSNDILDGKMITTKMNIYLNEVGLGIIDIPYDLNGAILLDCDPFRNAVNPYLNEVGIGELNEFLANQPTVGMFPGDTDEVSSIDEAMDDIEVEYDDAAKVLFVYIPDAYLNEVYQIKEASLPKAPLIVPNPLSGYLNMTYGHKIFHQKFPGIDIPQHVDYGNFDLALNIYDYVFQGFAYLYSGKPEIFNRGNLMLTHDIEAYKMRFALGDIGNFSFGLQNSIPLLGVSLSRGTNVFVNPTIASGSRNEFFLNAPSKVEVFVDGILYQTLDVSAGPHLLQNFPIIQGLNNVRLRITGPTGDTQSLTLNSFFLPNLLPKREKEFFFTFGFPSFDNNGEAYSYQFNDPTYSISGRYGLTPNFTVGGYAQGNRSGSFLGTQLIDEFSWLRTMLDAGISAVPHYDISGKIRLAFSNAKLATAPKLPFDFQLAFEATDKYFSHLDDAVIPQKNYLSVSGQLGKMLPFGLKTSVTGSYNFNNKVHSDNYRIQLKVQRNIFKSFLARLLFTWQGSQTTVQGIPQTKNNFFVALGIDFIPKDSNWSIVNDYNQQEQMVNSNINYSRPLRGDTKLDASLGVSHLPNATIGSGYANYTGQRMTIGLSEYVSNGPLKGFDKVSFPPNKNSTIEVTQVNIGTAVAMAGDTFAISRPIEDSFALVLNRKGDTQRYLRAYREQLSTRYNDSLGTMAAVVPTLKSYKEMDIGVDIYPKESWTPMMKTQLFKVRPHYKSGTVVKPKLTLPNKTNRSLKKEKSNES